MIEYDIALKIAEEAHKGQKDKIGADYILHPKAVAELCVDCVFFAAKSRLADTKSYTSEALISEDLKAVEFGKKVQIVALLHDVVEDTAITLDDLSKQGFSDEILAAVDAMTKREDELIADYLKRVAANDIAIIVKFADMSHNTSLVRATFGDGHWLDNPSKPSKMPKEQYIKNRFKYGERAYQLKQLVGDKYSLLNSHLSSDIEKLIREYLIECGKLLKASTDDC